MQKRYWTGCRGKESETVKDEAKQRDDVKVCITLAIPGETEKTEITHTKKAISVSAPKISLEFDKLSRQS